MLAADRIPIARAIGIKKLIPIVALGRLDFSQAAATAGQAGRRIISGF